MPLSRRITSSLVTQLTACFDFRTATNTSFIAHLLFFRRAKSFIRSLSSRSHLISHITNDPDSFFNLLLISALIAQNHLPSPPRPFSHRHKIYPLSETRPAIVNSADINPHTSVSSVLLWSVTNVRFSSSPSSASYLGLTSPILVGISLVTLPSKIILRTQSRVNVSRFE